MRPPGWLADALADLPHGRVVALAQGPLPEPRCGVCESLGFGWPLGAPTAATVVLGWHSEHQGGEYEADGLYAIGLEGVVSYLRCQWVYEAAIRELALTG